MGLDPVVATVGGVLLGVLLCTVGFIACRIWKRNRYYKKVQHSLDEEERAFQETLARSYQDDDTQLEGQDHEKLQMLETYMAMQQSGGNEIEAAEDAPLPSRAEEVDKFMAELAAAAAGGGLPGDAAGERQIAGS